MSDVVRTTAKDGSQVEFIYKDPAQGAVKDVYFAPDKSYVVAFFRNPLDPYGKERIENIVGKYRHDLFEQEGGEYWKEIFCWPEKIVEYDGRMGLVVPAYEKCYFFGSGPLEGAEKEGKWFASAKNFNKFVPPDEKGNLLSFLRICIRLSRGVRRLHAAGLAHSDLSYKNCLVDPKTGSACIIDVDGLVVPGLFPPDVLGTRDFMAPEVVATADGPKEKRELPKRTTDLHALAVLIYQYLLHRHPLRGSKVYSVETEVQESLEMGEKALFVEHPTDSSNRPKVGKSDNVCLPWIDVAKVPYKTTGPYLTELFNQAFVDGLHDPSRRPAAGDWEDALVKTTDLVLRCDNPNCVMKWFVYDNKTRPICPYCGTRYKKTAPIFDFYTSYHGGSYRPENRRMMIFDGQYLYLWHIDRNIAPNERLSNEDQKPVGYFSFYNNAWVFVNQRLPDLKNISTGELIPPGKGVTLTDKLWLLLSAKETGRAVYVRITNC